MWSHDCEYMLVPLKWIDEHAAKKNSTIGSDTFQSLWIIIWYDFGKLMIFYPRIIPYLCLENPFRTFLSS